MYRWIVAMGRVLSFGYFRGCGFPLPAFVRALVVASTLTLSSPIMPTAFAQGSLEAIFHLWLDEEDIEDVKITEKDGVIFVTGVIEERVPFTDTFVFQAFTMTFDLKTGARNVVFSQSGTNPTPSGAGNAINPDGSCFVGQGDSGFFTPFHAVRWTQATGLVDLGTLDPPNNANRSSSARAVNADCTVVVGSSDIAGGVTQHAFRWTQQGGMVDLGAPAGPARSSRAFGVSADGNIVVGDAEFVDSNTISGFRNGAYRWTGGTFQDLGALEPGFPSVANAVTSDGTVIVGEGGISITIVTPTGTTITNGSRAFRWTQAGGMQPIGPLPGDRFAAATAVSDNGNVVVGTSTSDGTGTRAYRWTAATGIQDLRQVLIDGGVDLTGITLTSARSLSRDGQWIAVEGTSPQTPAGETASFVFQFCDAAIGAACFQRAARRADFNGDGRSDILWRNASTGQNAIWRTNAVALTSSALIPAVDDANWRMVATGDFDGNGKGDILWRHAVTGENAIWLMNGYSLSSSALIPAVPDAAWTIAAAADFDGNGKTDILWRNTTTGQNAIWLMDGLNVAQATLIPGVPDTNWTIVRAGDFNGDGKADILWRNTSTGDNAIWIMNGTALTSSALIAAVPVAWAVAAVADYNRDGKADILWRNATTGDNAIWLMDGLTIATPALIVRVADAAWTIAASADYSVDSRADILWRNTTTGENAIWTMDGTTLASSVLIPGVADSNWRVVGE